MAKKIRVQKTLFDRACLAMQRRIRNGRQPKRDSKLLSAEVSSREPHACGAFVEGYMTGVRAERARQRRLARAAGRKGQGGALEPGSRRAQRGGLHMASVSAPCYVALCLDPAFPRPEDVRMP